MGKKIKAIKCPQCGSVDAEEIKPDVYLCKNCGAEFFLDSDDININHYFHTKPSTPVGNPNNKNALVGVFVCFFFIVSGIVLFNVLGVHKKNGASYAKEGWRDSETFFMETPDSQSVYIVVGKRTGQGKDGDQSPLFIGFYDAKTKKEQKLVQLPIKIDRLSVRFSQLSDGMLFFSVNDKNLFQVDKQSKNASEFTLDQYKDLRGLEDGIAKIDFLPFRIYEDCFRFINNAGQQVYYYPIIRKTYIGSQEQNIAERDYKSLPENAPTLTRFLFKSESPTSSQSGSKKYLIQYTQKLQVGYPVKDVRLAWLDRDRYNDAFKDKDSAVASKLNLVINGQDRLESHVLTFKDFTPGRSYFGEPAVLAQTDKMVLIAFMTSPAPDEKSTIQTLDSQTGKILWTYHVQDNSRMYYPQQGTITKDGCFVDFSRESVFFDHEGTLISEFSGDTY
ncbi:MULTISPECIES: hypothetical protein [Chitinophagaceae]